VRRIGGCHHHSRRCHDPLSNRTSAASTLAEHPLPLSLNSTKPSCLAQRALAGAPACLMAETTAAPPIVVSVGMMNARTRFFIGRPASYRCTRCPRLAGAAGKDWRIADRRVIDPIPSPSTRDRRSRLFQIIR
jgi:hypothetical protein